MSDGTDFSLVIAQYELRHCFPHEVLHYHFKITETINRIVNVKMVNVLTASVFVNKDGLELRIDLCNHG